MRKCTIAVEVGTALQTLHSRQAQLHVVQASWLQAKVNGSTSRGSPTQRVLMISGLGIRSDSAWFKHIVDHLASLRNDAGAPVACVCTFDPRCASNLG